VSTREIVVQSSSPSSVMVASGLGQGDVVVTAGVQALRPGQKVRFNEVRPSEVRPSEVRPDETRP
jgi:hypothetical protein